MGKQVGCYLGQWPKSSDPVRIRVGMHWHVVDGRAKDGYAFYDTPQYFDEAYGIDLFERAISGSPLPPACPSLAAAESAKLPERYFGPKGGGHMYVPANSWRISHEVDVQ